MTKTKIIIALVAIFVAGAIVSHNYDRARDLKAVQDAYYFYKQGSISKVQYNNICDLHDYEGWKVN